MAQIDWRITILVLLPFLLVVIAANLGQRGYKKYREAHRIATGKVTGFIGEMFGATQAIQVADAESHVMGQFRIINDERRRTAIKDRLFDELLTSIFRNTTSLGTGLILLLVGQSMASGKFTVGDFALFVYYLSYVTEFTGLIGHKIAWYQQVGIGEAIRRLMQDCPLVRWRKGMVYMRGELPPVHQPVKTEPDRLDLLEVRGLTYHYQDTQGGVENIRLNLKKGSFTVITGRVGSGKTTLLRILLGLLPKDSRYLLERRAVEDPATFSPPRSAYTAQCALALQRHHAG
jgi:ATP-binding cassette subfamily B protein